MRVISIIFQIIMEKSSQKIIRETSQLKNRFREMLSQVQIKLPTTLEIKQKPHNLVLEIQSYFDRSGQNLVEGRAFQQEPRKKIENNQNGRNNLGNFIINIPLKTKNSSLNKEHKILQRFLCLIEEKMQLIQPCQKDFENNENERLEDAFRCIQNYNVSQNYTFHNIQTIREEQKVPIMVNIITRICKIRLKSCFFKLIQFYRDSVLFGLSNTVGDLKDNSLLKLQSQSCYQGLQAGKQLKQAHNMEKQFSDMNISKKISQYGSESLSALILNHNELKISPELNQIYPNIPKSNKNINDKLIASKKQIAELQLQTKKKIQSSKKLIDSKDLPLDSRKNINDSNQEKVQNQVTTNNQEKAANRPITFTYILKNLDFNDALQSKEFVNSNKLNDNNIQKWNAIHGKMTKESQFQNPNRNVFMQENRLQPQRRSISLQIKPFQGLFISPSKPENPNNQGNSNRICNNQYYNQENCNRQNLMRLKCSFKDPFQTKPRAKSASPRVTFNFCSSNNPPPSPIVQNKVRVQQERQIKYQESDFIIQRSLIQDRNVRLVQIGTKEKQPKQNRLLVISPSSRRDSKHAARKLRTQQKESIKQRLLPPAFNDYYHKINQPQNQVRVPILSNSNFSTQPTNSQQKQIKKGNFKEVKKGLVNQVYFCEIEQPKQVGCQPTFCNKVQLQNSPRINYNKQKILVTFSNKNKS